MTSYTLSPVWGAGAQLFDNAGNVLTGGKIETYEAGTTTNAVTYTDPIGNFFNSNPIIADASGRLSNEIWLPVSGAYKFVLKDANNVLIATYDNIPTIPQPPIVNDASSISYEQGYAVTAGAFTVGATYLITSVGTTNFIAIGAAANATGILFTATGVGSGNGTAEYSRTVQTKLREIVSVQDFGAVGDGVVDDTLAIQAAFNFLEQNGGTLSFAPGTYIVTSVEMNQAGGNTRRNFSIIGNGALLQGTTSSAPFRIYRCQGLIIDGLRVAKHASATYASDLDSFWFANFTDCDFGATKLHSDDQWGVYWNEFNGCEFASIHFDLTDYTINQNIWKGGRVGGITKTDALHPTFKEAYNNVFIGVDLLGPIDWRDSQAVFKDPIVFRDCNMEYAGVNYGYIIAEGGRSNPQDALNTRFFPEDDFRSEFNQQYSGGSWVTGWHPWSSTNLFRGGACQSFSPDIGVIAVGANALATFADANSPTGNGYCYRLNFAGSSNARIHLTMPIEFLEQAKKVGFVSFSLWIYNVNGASFIASTTSAAPPTGDAFPTGASFPTNQWIQRFVTIPVPSSATAVNLYIGGALTTGYDVRVANISCTLGKIARPYTPSTNEPHPKRGIEFQKTLVANGLAQNTFSLAIPSSNTGGRLIIKAQSFGNDSVSIYQGELFYVRHNTGSGITANIVEQGKAQLSYGGATTGTVSAMTASATGSTVTVTTTIVAYSGDPSRVVSYTVEFLDANEALTIL